MWYRNPDAETREIERRIMQGDESAKSRYLQILLRQGQLAPEQIKLAAYLDYFPAHSLIEGMGEEPLTVEVGGIEFQGPTKCPELEISFTWLSQSANFWINRSRTVNWWFELSKICGVTDQMLVILGDWFLETGDTYPGLGDLSIDYISQLMVPRFQRAIENNRGVSGYDGGMLQDYAFQFRQAGLERSSNVVWFIFNCCEYASVAEMNPDRTHPDWNIEMERYARMALMSAINAARTVTHQAMGNSNDIFYYMRERLLELALPPLLL